LLHSSLAVLHQVAPESGSRTPVLFHYTFLTRGWPTGVRYLATLLIVSTMLALGLALDEPFHGFPFLLFSFAILISSALFDRGSGAFSVLLSGFFAKWFFIAPTGTIRVENTGGLIALSCFMAIGLATAAVVEALHRVASNLVEANHKLIASENEKSLLLEEASHRFRNELAMLGQCCAYKNGRSDLRPKVSRSAQRRIGFMCSVVCMSVCKAPIINPS
jgi:K+-sensing histidine kinase KdpD